MIDEKYLELINKEIDGVNSPAESARLKAYLAQDAAAQRLYRSLEATANLLQRVKDDVKPPATLKPHVLRLIESRRGAIKARMNVKHEVSSLLHSLVRRPLHGFDFRFAYVFASGLVAGGLVLYLLIGQGARQDTLRDQDLFGAMVSHSSAGRLATSDSAAFSFDGGHAVTILRGDATSLVVEVRLSSRESIDAALAYDESEFGFSTIRRTSGSPEGPIAVGENVVHLASHGESHYLITFARKTLQATPMTLKIFSSGTLLHAQDISPGGRNE